MNSVTHFTSACLFQVGNAGLIETRNFKPLGKKELVDSLESLKLHSALTLLPISMAVLSANRSIFLHLAGSGS
jgi:hypothetical protein